MNYFVILLATTIISISSLFGFTKKNNELVDSKNSLDTLKSILLSISSFNEQYYIEMNKRLGENFNSKKWVMKVSDDYMVSIIEDGKLEFETPITNIKFSQILNYGVKEIRNEKLIGKGNLIRFIDTKYGKVNIYRVFFSLDQRLGNFRGFKLAFISKLSDSYTENTNLDFELNYNDYSYLGDGYMSDFIVYNEIANRLNYTNTDIYKDLLISLIRTTNFQNYKSIIKIDYFTEFIEKFADVNNKLDSNLVANEISSKFSEYVSHIANNHAIRIYDFERYGCSERPNLKEFDFILQNNEFLQFYSSEFLKYSTIYLTKSEQLISYNSTLPNSIRCFCSDYKFDMNGLITTKLEFRKQLDKNIDDKYKDLIFQLINQNLKNLFKKRKKFLSNKGYGDTFSGGFIEKFSKKRERVQIRVNRNSYPDQLIWVDFK